MTKTEFVVLCGSAWMNEHGFGVAYDWDKKSFPTRQEAIDHGFTLGRSDDFNIGTVVDGKLAAIGWMDKDHDESPETLAEIGRQIYLA